MRFRIQFPKRIFYFMPKILEQMNNIVNTLIL